jgi:hypothetical protein
MRTSQPRQNTCIRVLRARPGACPALRSKFSSRTARLFSGDQASRIPKPGLVFGSLGKFSFRGSYQDVQKPEISVLLQDQSLTLDQVVEKVRPHALARLASRKDFADDAVLRDTAKAGRAVSIVPVNQGAPLMVHVSSKNSNDVIPQAGEYTMLRQEAAEQLVPQLIAALARRPRRKDLCS